MHEFVLSARRQKKLGVTAMDIAKRLLDLGFHAPSIYFPLIVEEALMIEPTETESKETLDAFCDAMIRIAKEAETDPSAIHSSRDDAGAPPGSDQGRARAKLEVARQGLGAPVPVPQSVDRHPVALLFDFGGTLDGAGLTWKTRAFRLYRAAGLAADPADFDPLFYAADDALVGTVPATLPLDETVRRLFAGISARARSDRPASHRAAGRPLHRGCPHEPARTAPACWPGWPGAIGWVWSRTSTATSAPCAPAPGWRRCSA